MNLLRKKDLLLAVPLLLLALALFLFRDAGGECTAVIESSGEEIARIELSAVAEPYRMEIPSEHHVVLLVEPGAISFVESDCPDQVCVRTGRLSSPGETAVCLPAKISVRLEGTSKSYDGITG